MILTYMKTSHDVEQIYNTILERFGEPIGDAKDAGEGVADERGGRSHKGQDMGNRGWGADVCEGCQSMLFLNEATCQACGMMSDKMDEDEGLSGNSDQTGDLTGKDIHIDARGKATVKSSSPGGAKSSSSSSSTQKSKSNMGPTVDWSGMLEADIDEVNLGISSRWGGTTGHAFDDEEVKEPEEVGAKLDTRDSLDVKKNDSKPMSLSMDEENIIDKVGKGVRNAAGKTFDNYGKVATAMSKVPGMPDVAKGALAGAGKFNKELGKIAKGDDEVDEVAPPGGEKVVKALKKQKGVKNPFAVAWAMKNKGEI